MKGHWTYVVHQQALESIDTLRPADRKRVREFLLHLVADPWQLPDGEIRPANDRLYFAKNVGAVRVDYWLDVFAKEVCVVRVDRL